MKCLKLFYLILPLLALLNSQFVKAGTNLTTTKTTLQKNKTYFISNDTIKVKECDFDTIRLVGRGVKYKGKVYYYSDKECKMVELKPQNKKGFWFGFISRILRGIFRG